MRVYIATNDRESESVESAVRLLEVLGHKVVPAPVSPASVGSLVDFYTEDRSAMDGSDMMLVILNDHYNHSATSLKRLLDVLDHQQSLKPSLVEWTGLKSSFSMLLAGRVDVRTALSVGYYWIGDETVGKPIVLYLPEITSHGLTDDLTLLVGFSEAIATTLTELREILEIIAPISSKWNPVDGRMTKAYVELNGPHLVLKLKEIERGVYESGGEAVPPAE